MDIVIKMIGVIGGIMTVIGLFSVLTGALNFFSGRKNENPQKMDSGIESMIMGGAMAAISGGITAAIIAAVGAIRF